MSTTAKALEKMAIDRLTAGLSELCSDHMVGRFQCPEGRWAARNTLMDKHSSDRNSAKMKERGARYRMERAIWRCYENSNALE